MKKSQTGSEYVMIISVVLIIGLLIAVLLGVFPDIGGIQEQRAQDFDLTKGQISIDNIGSTDSETKLVLRNNQIRPVDLNDVSIEGYHCDNNQLPVTLNPGDKQTVTCTNINDTIVNKDFTPSVSVLWCDYELGQEFSLTTGYEDENFTFSGSCSIPTVSFHQPAGPVNCNQTDSTGSSAGVFYNGDGSLGSPYGVCNCTMLQDIENDLNVHYAQLSPIDCSDTINWNTGDGWSPISTFTGSFDGGNYNITDLYISSSTGSKGLFGSSTGANFSNMQILNATFSGSSNGMGFLTANAIDVNITNVDVSGSFVASGQVFRVGGLVGRLTSGSLDIINSNTLVNFSGQNAQVAGILGRSLNPSTLFINQSSSRGVIEAEQNVGGFLGAIESTTTIDQSFSNVNLSHTGAAGGSEFGPFIGSFFFGTRTISNSYSWGDVLGATGSKDCAGLIVEGFSGTDTVSNFYSISDITTNCNTGDAMTSFTSPFVSMSNVFWDNETMGTDVCGDCSGTFSGEDTATMQTEATFTGAGWDFSNIWEMGPSGYPELRWQ